MMNKAIQAAQQSKGFDVKQDGDLYMIEIINPVEYASYVEYGHRTANHKGWVPGKFVMTRAEAEIQALAPKVLEAKIKKWLQNTFS
ncbi:MAG: HK97 gp10 family phage protein [Acutalibacteraceae bacterium]|nr:HK97 gp10 family phage protein [Acutalibacteraceae bacterium]